MLMMKDVLASLNLNPNEIDVYLTALQIGSAPASILARRTKMTRSTAKYTCKQLHKKGLFTTIQKNKTFIYTAEPPDKLLFLIKQQIEDIKHKETQVNRILGELKNLQNPYATLPQVRFYEGVDGIIEMLEDVLGESKPIYGTLSLEEEKDFDPKLWKYFSEVYILRRKQKKQPARFLFTDTAATRDYQKKDADMNRISLLLPEDLYPFDMCTQIYGEKVAFYSYKKFDMTGVLIQNAFINQNMMALFRAAWNFARQLPVNKQYIDIKV
jgi:sugar-specific transcriptional regulator TrmB